MFAQGAAPIEVTLAPDGDDTMLMTHVRDMIVAARRVL